MNLEEYVKTNSRDDRTTHIDLSEECIPVVLKINTSTGKKGDWASGLHGPRIAKKELLSYLGIDNVQTKGIHTCHLCPNNSATPNGFVCQNPKHLYFGTQSENELDKPHSVRMKFSRDGVKASNIQATCPHCGKTGQKRAMMRCHWDRCKHR